MNTTERTNRLRRALDGISGILVAPYRQNELVPALLRPIIDKAIGAGVHVLVANGNTGEYYGLTTAETEQFVTESAELIGGRVPLLGGVGRNIKEACNLAKVSRAAGVDGLMVHQPPDPFVSPRGVLEYVSQIAEAADGLPLVLYLRNENIGLKTLEALCRIPSVVGVKWASASPLVLGEAINATRDLDIAWVGGLAETWAPTFYAVGARGFTSGLINVFPEHSVAVYQALEAGDYALANALIRKISVFEELRAQENNGTNVTVVKAALQLLGQDCGMTRPPSAWPLTAPAQARLVEFVDAFRS